MKIKRADIILIILVLFLAGAAFGWQRLQEEPGRFAVVKTEGMETARYPLSEEREERIEGTEGYNILVIRDGEASVKEADCPDRICVRERAICHVGETIVCLPHRLVVSIEGEEKGAPDGIAR